MGLLRHGDSEKLQRARERALSMLIDRYSPMDPFRFIIYSQWANMALRPIDDGQAEPR